MEATDRLKTLTYVRKEEVVGTWLESHFRWQIRTFWFGLLWAALCVLFVVSTLGVGLLIAWVPLGFQLIDRIELVKEFCS